MPKKKRTFKQALTEFLESWEDEDEDDAGDDSDDVITLRGPAARKLLGIVDDDGDKSKKKDGDDEDDEPEAETKPQRGQSRYFDNDDKTK